MGPRNVNMVNKNVIGVDSGLKNKSIFNPANTNMWIFLRILF